MTAAVALPLPAGVEDDSPLVVGLDLSLRVTSTWGCRGRRLPIHRAGVDASLSRHSHQLDDASLALGRVRVDRLRQRSASRRSNDQSSCRAPDRRRRARATVGALATFFCSTCGRTTSGRPDTLRRL